jgi:hypothetical protein
MILYSKVERVESEVLELRRSLDKQADRQDRFQLECEKFWQGVKEGLDKFMNWASEQGTTPMEEARSSKSHA